MWRYIENELKPDEVQTIQELEKHIDGCAFCTHQLETASRRQMRRVVDVANATSKPVSASDELEPAMSIVNPEPALAHAEPSKLRVVEEVGATPAHASQEKSSLFLKAASFVLVPLLLFGVPYVVVELRKMAAMREELGLNDYVRFATHTEKNPSTEPGSIPAYTVKDSVVLAGRVRPQLIERIEISSDPPLDVVPEPITFETPDLGGVEFKEFDRWIRMPKDGRERTMTVRLVPRSEALAADPHGLSEQRLTYVFAVAPGPRVLDRNDLWPQFVDVKPEGQALFGTLQARGGAGGLMTVAIRPKGHTEFYCAEPQRINKFGQESTFRLFVGAADTVEIAAFASRDDDPQRLIEAITRGDHRDLLSSGDTRTIHMRQGDSGEMTGSTGAIAPATTLNTDAGQDSQRPPAASPPLDVADGATLARISAEPTTDIYRATVEVTLVPELLNRSDVDVWIGVVPVMAPGSMWLQDSPLGMRISRRVIYLGLPNKVTTEAFQVCVVTAPAGTATEGEVKIATLRQRGIKVVSDVLTINRTR
ncbi:MAG: hypothetical protein HQ492_05110 [Woeseiaceae bacterium]|nr:hypothetical protein [Woeseiaceae bacterium]